MGLSERDLDILDFERSWWRGVGPKHDAIRARLGLSASRYYELLAALVDHSEAERHDPLLVRRLRLRRDRQRRARYEGRPSSGWRAQGRPQR